jgi:hypothetical protein
MNLKLNNSEEVAIMTSLQHYLKEVEKMGEEKGVQIEKKTLSGLISRLESMPAGEVWATYGCGRPVMTQGNQPPEQYRAGYNS